MRAKAVLETLKAQAEAGANFSDFSAYAMAPSDLLREVVGVKSATRRSTGEAYQSVILNDLAKHLRVAVRSGHGTGKSALDSWATIWWLLTRPYSRVVIVAPEFSRQIRAVLFAEIRKWVRRSKTRLPLEVLANRVLVEGFGDEWGAIGVPATEPDRIEGFHAEGGVLLILDETKGIPNEVYDALMGALTGEADNRLLVTSTPGPPCGIFSEIFSSRRDDWVCHHIPSPDSSLVSEAWVEQRRREWGESGPLYQARVLGDFPEQAEGTLIPLSDLEAAVAREIPDDPNSPPLVRLGVDVARFGDDLSCVALWRKNTLETITTRSGLDTMRVAAWVSSEIHRLRPRRVRVDEIGIGAGVFDRLRQLGHANVEGVNVARRSTKPELFQNLRSELYWSLREALAKGEVALPDNDRLIAELSAVKYGFTPSGQIALEKKADTAKRAGESSTDLADAAVLGFAEALGTYIGDLDLSVNEDLAEPSRWRIEDTWTSGKIY